MADLHDASRRVFSALEDVLAATASTETDAAAAAQIGAFARRVAAIRAVPPSGPGDAAPAFRLPVCRFWDRALAGAASGATAELAACLRALGPALPWIRNPNYRRPPDPRFLENYGYAVIAGPPAGDTPAGGGPLVAGDGLAVGVLLLGPGTHYPLHRHPAAELYCVVAGTAAWRRGESPWREEPPGAVIHHPPDLPHATRSGAAPLLAVYLWRGDLATDARLIPSLPRQVRRA